MKLLVFMSMAFALMVLPVANNLQAAEHEMETDVMAHETVVIDDGYYDHGCFDNSCRERRCCEPRRVVRRCCEPRRCVRRCFDNCCRERRCCEPRRCVRRCCEPRRIMNRCCEPRRCCVSRCGDCCDIPGTVVRVATAPIRWVGRAFCL